jgi:hypothetical protein
MKRMDDEQVISREPTTEEWEVWKKVGKHLLGSKDSHTLHIARGWRKGVGQVDWGRGFSHDEAVNQMMEQQQGKGKKEEWSYTVAMYDTAVTPAVFTTVYHFTFVGVPPTFRYFREGLEGEYC